VVEELKQLRVKIKFSATMDEIERAIQGGRELPVSVACKSW